MKAITLFILLSIPVFLVAQDELHLKNGVTHSTKILEITPEVVKYKLFGFQEGPTYTIKRSDIQKRQTRCRDCTQIRQRQQVCADRCNLQWI